MLGQLYTEMGSWFWFVLGMFLIGLEIFASGTFFLWFGIAAILVGSLDLAVDLAWQINALLFLLTAIGSFLCFRRFSTMREAESETPMLNQRAKGLIGREFELSEDIINGSGRVKIDDTFWRISGPDLAKGEKIRVVDSNSSNLRVEKVLGEDS